MPETPISDSAARTSSSLKGLMMAVTSFMGLFLLDRDSRREGFCSFHATTSNARQTRAGMLPGQSPAAAGAPLWSSSSGPPHRTSAPQPCRSIRLFFAPMYQNIVIVGAGQAAVQAVDTLRRKGFTGKLTLVGEEPWLPYQRPPLSKKYLAGTLERERLLIRPATFFTEHKIEAHLGRRVTDIAPRERHVRLDDGLVLPYDALLIATGSRPRRLPIPGIDLAGVHTLRTIADADRIRAACAAGGRLLIIGGGYIGLEVAATARELGMEVTVLEMAERVMNRVTCPEVSAFYAAEHARQGVRISCHETVRALHGEPGGRVRAAGTDAG